MKHRKLILLFVIVIFLFILAIPTAIQFYTDWLWFGELGYTSVLKTRVATRWMLGLFSGLITFGVLWLNFAIAHRVTRPLGLFSPRDRDNPEDIALGYYAEKLRLPLSLLFGLIAGIILSNEWTSILQYIHGVPFGQADPIFGRDLSFYFFKLPVLELVNNFALTIVGLSLVTAFIFYMMRSVFLADESMVVNRTARRHLLALAALFFVPLGIHSYLEIPGLLYSNRGLFFGAGYTDIEAIMPTLKILMVTAWLTALLIIVTLLRNRNSLAYLGITLYGLVFIIGMWIYPASVQHFTVAPNELVKETPYLLHNIAETRKAFNLDKVEERNLTGQSALTLDDIHKNDATIKNVRLWDDQPLLDTFSQIQEIRTYYDFLSVDHDRYMIDGQQRQVMLSPRELSSEHLPQRNWINEHLTFTHGYGLTLGPVNQVASEGLPVLMVKDIPPSSSVPSLQITRPEIYFGEVTNDYIFVKTRAKEFNYPSGDENVFSEYEGSGGVPIGSLARRLLFATSFGSTKIILSDDLTPDSRVLYRRNIQERAIEIAPFLRLDRDPYLVVRADGTLTWIQDAFTVSDRYPYAQPIDGINYIRNSVKIVTDAYNGSMKFFISDESDPLIRTYVQLFPGLFLPLSEMPADLRAHLRYPHDIFSIQTTVYATYHMDHPQIFYNQEDQWEIPSLAQGDKAVAIEPYYTIMRLPGEQGEEFILMLPFTPKNKANLSAWMVARSDGENYGKLRIYRFPKQQLVFGPKQIVDRINQDSEISRQITLWDQRGSEVIQGTLLVIPIKESLIYVRPLYLRAEGGKIPELKRVVVAYENNIAMSDTLEESLTKIFGATPEAPKTEAPIQKKGPETPEGDSATLAARAREHYERAIKAQREGDWALYGEEIKRLGEVISQMQKR
jgi:uncharacterized protein